MRAFSSIFSPQILSYGCFFPSTHLVDPLSWLVVVVISVDIMLIIMEYNVTNDKSWMLFAIVLKLHLVQRVSLRETLLRGGGGGRWRMRQNGGMFSTYLTDVQTSLCVRFMSWINTYLS